MKKLFLAVLMLLITMSAIVFADTKISEMPDLDATPESTDILYIIDDPGGTPVSKKITVGNLLGSLTIGTDVQAYDADTAKTDTENTWTAANHFSFGNLTIGVEDSVAGRTYLYNGGELVLENSSANDSTVNSWWLWPSGTTAYLGTNGSLEIFGFANNGTLSATSFAGAGGALTITTTNFGTNFANDTDHDTIQELMDVIDDLSFGGSGDVTAASNFGTDNVLIKSDGTSKGTQATGITVDDSDNISGVGTLGCGAITSSGAITGTSLSTAASATPTFTLADSDDAAGTGAIYANSDGGSNDIILSIGVEDSTGENTPYIEVDGVSKTVDFLKNTTLQAGDITGTEIADDTIDSANYAAGSIDNEHLADDAVDTEEIADDAITAALIDDNAVTYAATAGSYKAQTPMTDDADNFAANFTGAYLYGGTFVANGAGDIDLPEPVAGMNFTIITMGDIAVDILPASGDDLLLDGVQLDDNHDASNADTAGDIAVVQYYDADGWLITSNGWTEVAD